MIISNLHSLSPARVEAARAMVEAYDSMGYCSVTDLSGKTPKIFWLTKRHEKEIVIDVMDLRPAFRGWAMHNALQSAAPTTAITEQRFTIKIAGKEISMKPDTVDMLAIEGEPNHAILRDYKFCKVYAIRNLKPEWYWQLNCYAFGLRKRNVQVVQILLECDLTDWDRFEALRDSRYPTLPIVVKEVPMASNEQIEQWMFAKVQAIMEAETKPDADLPDCTLEERWGDPDHYAVKKLGGKNALPNCSEIATRAEAEAVAAGKTATQGYQCEIEFRKGNSRRCSGSGDWAGCPVRNWCTQYQTKIAPAF